MHPSFDQFDAALRAPGSRAGIGLEISDADAVTLLSNEGWARDYYASWIAMFPASSTTPQAGSSGQPLGTRPVLVLVTAIVVLVGIAALALIIPTLTHSNVAIATTAADTTPSGSSTASATPTPSPSSIALAGLDPILVEYIDASLAVEGTSLEQVAAEGASVDVVQALAKTLGGVADLECKAYSSLPNGFQTAGVKDTVIAKLEKGLTIGDKKLDPTAAQAERIWTATVAYCAAKH